LNFKKENILHSVELILSNKEISYLTEEAYKFITLYCGSIAHYSKNGWCYEYSDLRDFVNFFLKRNEYGDNLSDEEKSLYRRQMTAQEREVVEGIVELCERYKEGIFAFLDELEGRKAKELARQLETGQIKLRDLGVRIS
jgi:hypothetical protein